MDVASDEDIERGFAHLKSRWDGFDILVHAVAFAPREALTGTFIDATTREGFRVAHDISSYSLTALARASLPFMQGRAGAIAHLELPGRGALAAGLQRHGPRQGEPGGQRALPGRGLGAAGRAGQRASPPARSRRCPRPAFPACARCCAHVAAVSPIKRNVTIEDVGNAAAFLCSDLAAGITGEILYVDGGYSTVGMSFPEAGDGA